MDPFEKHKIERLIKKLNALEGSSTSMITLVIGPGTQLSQVSKRILEEKGKASNVKCQVNRKSIIAALESITQKLKLYTTCPKNGLIIFCGECGEGGSSTKKVNIAIEPPRPINTRDYDCGDKFNTTVLASSIIDESVYGYIVIDGQGILFARLDGDHKRILPNSFTVDLPKKHGRGGQSALRFSRIRVEKRHNYITKAKEECVKCFISDDKVNVKGLIIAGLAELKNELADCLDPRISAVVIELVDVAHGGELGLNEAINLTAGRLDGLKLQDEINDVEEFFGLMKQDKKCYAYGFNSVHGLLMDGVVKKLLIWTEHELPYTDEELGEMPYIDWLIEKKLIYGYDLRFITDKTAVGQQFIKGFGGLGAILRYSIDDDTMMQFEEDTGVDKVNSEDITYDLDDYM